MIQIVLAFRLTKGEIMDTQHMQILRYLETHKGGITPMDAFHKLRITKLATRISELISKGYRFTKMWEESVGEDGSRTRYMRYYLDGEEQLHNVRRCN